MATLSPGGHTLRLCRELCFSLVRKNRADCVSERVKGLDVGRKSAGSVAVGKSKKNVRKSKELGCKRRHIGVFLLARLQTYTCCTVKVLLGQTCIHVTWNSVTSQQQQLSATFQSLRNSPAGPLPPFHHSDNVTSVTAPSCLHVSQQIQQHSPPIIPTSARSQPKPVP